MAITEGLHSGFVLPNQFTNPVQVWVPDFDGWFGLGESRNIGYNTLNALGSSELAEMRGRCHYYYLTQGLNAGNYYYDSTMGGGTMESQLPLSKTSTNLPDFRKGDYTYTHKGTMDGKSFTLDNSWPADTDSFSFAFDSELGWRPDCGVNEPTGEFVAMSNWRRVLVQRIDNGSNGVVMSVLPWEDEYNEMIEQTRS